MLTGLNRKTVKIAKWDVRLTDLAFIAVFGVLAAYFFLTAPYGITEVDEAVYQYYDYRLVTGDRLLADDWNFSNLFSVFTYLPYRIFFAVSGGTEGILMGFRYLHAVFKLAFYALIYFSLRGYGLWAILAGGIFVGTDLFGVKTVSYYSVCIFACLLAGLLLFVKKEPGLPHTAAAGFFFSCAVVAEPTAALVWFAYGALVLAALIVKKRGKQLWRAYGFILSPKVWTGVFIGVLAGAALFLASCALLFTGTDLKAILTGVTQMLQSAGQDPENGVSTAMIRLNKPLVYAVLYNRVLFILFFAAFAFGVLFHRFTKEFEKPVFAALAVLYAAMSVKLFLTPAGLTGAAAGECSSHALLLSFLGWAAYVFTPEKNRRMFAFLVFSFAVSLVVDCTSNVTFACMLLIGAVPSVILLRDYVCAFFAAPRDTVTKGKAKDKRGNKTNAAAPWFCAVLCALLVFIPLYEASHYVYMGRLYETERIFVKSDAPLDTAIPEGALKGVVTTRALAENYAGSLRDARRIGKTAKNGCCVLDFAPSVYLDAQTAVNEPWLHFFTDGWKGEELWWDTHPGRLPDVFYIPYETLCYMEFEDDTYEAKMAYLQSVAEVSVENGEAGYIVSVDRWVR